jgi:hypothetical protein
MTRAGRVYAALERGASNALLRLAYFSVVALAAMWPALGTATQLNAYQDAQHFSLFEEAARVAVARFHELPLWDPYYCGGIPGLGTPSARFAAPTFLLTLVFGTLRGATLASFVMTLVGLEGMYRYVRHRGGGALAATTVAPVFALSGVFAHATLVAWTNFFGFELVPWVALGARLAARGSVRGLVLAALAVAWMIGFGGTYTAPLTALLVAFELASLLATDVVTRRWSRIAPLVGMAIVLVVLSVAVSMVRLWPVAENLAASPRLLGGKPGMAPLSIVKMLVGEKGSQFLKGDFLIGLPVVPLVLAGVFRRRALPSLALCVLSYWFALGYRTEHSIFEVLRTIPPYTMLRAPERFLVFMAFGAATVAALGVRGFEVAARRRYPSLFLVALACQLVLVGDAVLLVHLGQTKEQARHLDPEPPIVEREFRQSRGNRWLAAYYPFMSRGTLTCFDDYDVAQSPLLRGDLPLEEYLKDPSAGTVKRAFWSPDRVVLDVHLTKSARVYVNQNWHPGWRASDGDVVSEDGLLAVDLPAGSHEVSLEFKPRSAIAGLAVTLVALVQCAFLLWFASRKDTVDDWRGWGAVVLASASPLVLVPLSFALIHEPGRPPLPLLTPSGEPMLVDAAPPDIHRIHARFDEGIILEGASVELDPPEEGRGASVHVELDWRFDAPVPPGLGVFLQFERQGGRFATDHVLLSGVLVPESAPLHTIVRDVSDAIPVPEAKGSALWVVYGGVWRARRDMSRLKVIDPGTSKNSSDRVLVGSFVVAPEAPGSGPNDRQTP